jgi:hypothetical protein
VANLTLVIDEAVLRRARIKALEQGTSVNAVVRSFIDEFAGEDEQMKARRAIVESARKYMGPGSGPGGRTWTRDDLYEERLARFGPDRYPD